MNQYTMKHQAMLDDAKQLVKKVGLPPDAKKILLRSIEFSKADAKGKAESVIPIGVLDHPREPRVKYLKKTGLKNNAADALRQDAYKSLALVMEHIQSYLYAPSTVDLGCTLALFGEAIGTIKAVDALEGKEPVLDGMPYELSENETLRGLLVGSLLKASDTEDGK